jgi:5-formyltetrahydrofolate cyclo-ligase
VIAHAKAELRAAMRAKRARLDPERAGAALVDHYPDALLVIGPVSFYWPMLREIDPRPLAGLLAGRGHQLCLPRLQTRDSAMCFHAWRDGDELTPDAFGVMAPRADAQIITPAVLLIPLLAFDRAGGRLGYGAGHYDRTLAGLKSDGARAIGLAFAEQQVDAVPMDAQDQRLDWVVTPLAAIDCNAGDKPCAHG